MTTSHHNQHQPTQATNDITAKFMFYHEVCAQFPMSAVNVHYSHLLLHTMLWPCAAVALAVQQSINIPYPPGPGPQQQTCCMLLQQANGTDGWTLYHHTDPALHSMWTVPTIPCCSIPMIPSYTYTAQYMHPNAQQHDPSANQERTHTYTHPFNGPFPGLPR